MTTEGIHPTADLDDGAQVGSDTVVWHLAQVRRNAVVGAGCTIGRGAYIGDGAVLGDNCKIQNYALVYEPAVLGDGVFVGPGAILTNDEFPRAVTPEGTIKAGEDWTRVGVSVGRGASIGARAVCVAPVNVGSWAMVGAGAVVTEDVPSYALVIGVPARQVGWVGEVGLPLERSESGDWTCPRSGNVYRETAGELERLSRPPRVTSHP